MEENKPIFNDIQIDFIGSQQLTETSRWAKFLGIIFISLAAAFLLLIFITWNKIKASVDQTSENGNQAALIGSIIIGILACIVVLLMYFLIRAMNRIRTSLRTKDQNLFNSGLQDLKVYFTIFGVIGIISLILRILTFFIK